jgi:hypothetical protein
MSGRGALATAETENRRLAAATAAARCALAAAEAVARRALGDWTQLGFAIARR